MGAILEPPFRWNELYLKEGLLCGVPFEDGTIVGINTAVMHHDTTIFGDDAGAFRPEKWI